MNVTLALEQLRLDEHGASQERVRLDKRISKVDDGIEALRRGTRQPYALTQLLSYRETLERQRKRTCARQRDIQTRIANLSACAAQDTLVAKLTDPPWRLPSNIRVG